MSVKSRAERDATQPGLEEILCHVHPKLENTLCQLHPSKVLSRVNEMHIFRCSLCLLSLLSLLLFALRPLTLFFAVVVVIVGVVGCSSGGRAVADISMSSSSSSSLSFCYSPSDLSHWNVIAPLFFPRFSLVFVVFWVNTRRQRRLNRRRRTRV